MFSKKIAANLLLVLLCIATFSQSYSQEEDSTLKAFNRAIEIRYHNPDSTLYLLEKVYKESLIKGDTLRAVNALLEMPNIDGQLLDYSKTYDDLWQALFLSENLNNPKLTATIYGYLGRVHSYFKRKEKAFQYLNTSLNLKKDLVQKKAIDKSELTYNYYTIVATHRETNQHVLGRKYLDSCLLYANPLNSPIDITYLKFEEAFILLKENKLNEALALFNEIEPWFIKNRPSYLVLVYTYWGDTFKAMNLVKNCEKMYHKALDISKSYNSHKDFTVLIHERLSDFYLEHGNYKKSYVHLKNAKNLDALFFDSRSEKNKSFLGIRDEYRIEKERQEKVIQKQRLAQLEQEDKISLLQRIILLGSLIFGILIGLIYVKQLRIEHKAEKSLIRKNKRLEIQKAKELLELKNKELAASALQLVEKDEFLRQLKNNLKESKNNTNTTEINKVIKSISISNDQSWEEFKLRFTAVNEKFYKTLTSQFPKLSQGDQKICALIKLNFSSKDMARLLGISVESVHTTRYRLRKKMGLPRSTNLENFIASI
ncbi:hypothetical protein [uncultured Maribacter sp.]|uniref:helix-turn-helix transcriptional regulator n=1 Tax=uncultured Maribacter sp. TaxID=431308 RepID=UPI0026240D3B|nr:hypothetical protein [uncultured Maribacter sp.]